MSDKGPPRSEEGTSDTPSHIDRSTFQRVTSSDRHQWRPEDHSEAANTNERQRIISSGENSLFDDFLDGVAIFDQKDVLRPSYTPSKLPHRDEQIDKVATILSSALRGDSPSNILIYGKVGTGKTASAKFVSQELQRTSEKFEVPCLVQYINCEVTDTRYRVFAKLANEFIRRNADRLEGDLETLRSISESPASDTLSEHGFDSSVELIDRIRELKAYEDTVETVPMTGWPTDRVYSQFFQAVDLYPRVSVIMLDEIDKLVEKSGDDTLYHLSRMNGDLGRSKVSIIGISNNLTFTDFLDPRVKSSLGEEEVVFPPYDAEQLGDILRHRAKAAFQEGVLSEDVIPLCAAFAAQEHGDARKALDLLRTAGELAERLDGETVDESHVREAKDKIELDRIEEAIRTLPTQSKIILLSIIRLVDRIDNEVNTGEVYNAYDHLCTRLDVEALTKRRVTDLISELDMLGIINAVVVSRGRYGRSREIGLSVPLKKARAVVLADSRLQDVG